MPHILDHVSITVSDLDRSGALAFLLDPDGNRIEAVCHEG